MKFQGEFGIIGEGDLVFSVERMRVLRGRKHWESRVAARSSSFRDDDNITGRGFQLRRCALISREV